MRIYFSVAWAGCARGKAPVFNESDNGEQPECFLRLLPGPQTGTTSVAFYITGMVSEDLRLARTICRIFLSKKPLNGLCRGAKATGMAFASS